LAPQFTTPITIRVESMERTEYLNQMFTQEEYHCYVGTDEYILVIIPEYDDYQVEVIVGVSW
jgi:hypothetical protein